MYLNTGKVRDTPLQVQKSFPCPETEGVEGPGDEVQITARLERCDDGFQFDGLLSTTVGLVCSRCDTPYPHQVESKFELRYRAPSSSAAGKEEAADVELTRDDCAAATLEEDGRLDLLALTREQIYISIPMKPVCRDDCQGLCSQCGMDLNKSKCDCMTAVPDPRLAALAQLKIQS